jgi:hypothetical protein
MKYPRDAIFNRTEQPRPMTATLQSHSAATLTSPSGKNTVT